MNSAEPVPIVNTRSGASLLSLADGAEWPQLKGAPLFVRHFYKDCFEGPMESLKPGSRFAIIGNGGSELLLLKLQDDPCTCAPLLLCLNLIIPNPFPPALICSWQVFFRLLSAVAGSQGRAQCGVYQQQV